MKETGGVSGGCVRSPWMASPSSGLLLLGRPPLIGRLSGEAPVRQHCSRQALVVLEKRGTKTAGRTAKKPQKPTGGPSISSPRVWLLFSNVFPSRRQIAQVNLGVVSIPSDK